MNNKLSLFTLRQRLYRILELGTYPFIALMFTLLMCWQTYMVYLAKIELSQEKDALSALLLKLDTYKENSKISEQDRIVYGTMLKRQIPANNNTFDTFALIESFYDATGIELKPSQSGSVGGGNTTHTNLTSSDGFVDLYTGSGVFNQEKLDEILSMYQYHFPKFLTLRSIKVAKSKEGNGLFYDVTFFFQTHSLNSNEKQDTKIKNVSGQFTAEDKRTFDRYILNANTDLYYETQSPPPVIEQYDPAGKIF